MIEDSKIPIIDAEEDGYWEIYPDRMIWHQSRWPGEDNTEVYKINSQEDIIKIKQNKMKSCEKALDEATKKGDYTPQLQLFVKIEGGGTQPTGPHRVKLISDRVIKARDFQTKEEIYKIELLLEEDGVEKTYSFRAKDKLDPKKPHYLVERFANVKAGTEVILEGKKTGKASYVDVKIIDGQGNVSKVDEDNIPTIEENGGGEEEINVEDIPF